MRKHLKGNIDNAIENHQDKQTRRILNNVKNAIAKQIAINVSLENNKIKKELTL